MWVYKLPTSLLKTSTGQKKVLDFPQQTHTQSGILPQVGRLFPEQATVH